MQKEEVLETSNRGQPVPEDVLQRIEKQEFYREDQSRDDHGRFEDEGGGGVATKWTESDVSKELQRQYDDAMASGYDADKHKAAYDKLVSDSGWTPNEISGLADREFDEAIREGEIQKPAPQISKPEIPSDYTTQGVTTTFNPHRTQDSFEIKHKSGATVTGFWQNQDFPNDTQSVTRGEIFLTSVPEVEQHKGLGYSLNADAIKLLKKNGAKTVNLSPVSEGGKAIVDKMMRDGLIHGPIRTSTTGKAEYSLT